jgi:hypothetical protein
MGDIADGVHGRNGANHDIRAKNPMAGHSETTLHGVGRTEHLTHRCSRSCPDIALSDWA